MKLVTFITASGEEHIGAQVEDGAAIVDFAAAAQALEGAVPRRFETMLDLIDAGPAGLDAAYALVDAVAAQGVGEARLDAAAVRLRAPVPVPRSMRDCLAFEKHFRQARQQALEVRAAAYPDPEAAKVELRKTGRFEIPKVWYELPVYYKGNRFTVVGPEDDILWPKYCEKLDYEHEFGIFIGKAGKDIARERAAEHIYGYTIFNDMSARDAQYKEYEAGLGPAKGKDFDTGNIMGPCLVTADEIADPYDLVMVSRINGEERGRGNSGEMHHRFEDMIAHISRDETIHPGEFIGSGTVGDGCGLEHGRWLAPGDVIELEIEGIGLLRNRLRGKDDHPK